MTTKTSSRDLAARLADLLRREHDALAEFLLALAEFDRARAWEPLGYAGLFPFLHRELGLSKASAFFRMRAAQLIQQFPEVIEPLRDGRLCLASVVELAKVLTAENRESVLPRFFHCSKQEAKAISAELAPLETPPQRAVVTTLAKLPATASVPPLVTEAEPTEVRPGEPVGLEAAGRATPAPPSPPRDEAVPLTATQSRLHVTVSREFLDKLEAARMALSHSKPGASVEDVLEAGLDLVLTKDAKKKAIVARPRPWQASADAAAHDPGRVPAEIRREVWKRDCGCCQWELASGGVCGSKLRPEIDHIVPRAKGGPTTLSNLRILCRVHNQLAARLEYGERVMDRYRRRPGATTAATVVSPCEVRPGEPRSARTAGTGSSPRAAPTAAGLV